MNCIKCFKLIEDENKCESDPAVCSDCCCEDSSSDDCVSISIDKQTEEIK